MENTFNTSISNMELYSMVIEQAAKVDSMPKNILPWTIRPTDCFGRDIAIGDNVAFILTNYQDRFKKICQGTIVGFTECFVKIKPSDEYKDEWNFKRYKKEKCAWETADFVLRIPNRVIKL